MGLLAGQLVFLLHREALPIALELAVMVKVVTEEEWKRTICGADRSRRGHVYRAGTDQAKCQVVLMRALEWVSRSQRLFNVVRRMW